MTTSRARRLVVSIVVLFGLQGMVVHLLEEPYPALLMPGFGSVLQDAEGRQTLRTLEIEVAFADGEVEALSAATLLAEAPSSQHGAMALWFDAPEAEVRPSERGWRGLARRWLPGLAAADRRHFGPRLGAPMRAWLVERLEELYPARRPVRMAFIWFEERMDVAQGELRRARSQDAVVRVEFADARP